MLTYIASHPKEVRMDREHRTDLQIKASNLLFKKELDLEDIASAKGMNFDEFLTELEAIVASGTKLNLDYYIDEVIDEEKQEEVFDYFRTAETDSIDDAMKELGEEDFTMEEIRLMRIKFISELGN
jgi:ATP-dependent DNA helicase RecQ